MVQDSHPTQTSGSQAVLLARLLRASEALSQSLHLPAVLQILTDTAADLLGLPRIAIYLVEGETLFMGASSPPLDGDLPDALRRTPLADHPHIQRTIRTAAAVAVPDARNAAMSPAEQQIVDLLDLRTIIYLPVVGRSGVLGILIASATTTPQPMDATLVDIGRTLCGLAAVAIENARLYRASQEELAERNRIEAAQRAQIALMQIVAETSTAMATVTTSYEFDQVTQDTLVRLGECFDADHAVLFSLSEDLVWLNNTHEWCAAGIAPQIDRLQNWSLDNTPWLKAQMGRRAPLHVPDVAALPPEAELERTEWDAQDVRAFILVPTIGAKGRLFGYLGLEMVRRAYTWSDDQIAMLGIVATTIGNTLERLAAVAARHELQERLSLLSDQIPGILYQLRMQPDGTSYFPYANAGVRAYYGVGPERLRDDAAPAFAPIHPDDIAKVQGSIAASAADLTPWHQVYRMYLPSGETIWVEGRATPQRLADGSVVWHGYIEDVTEQQRLQSQLIQAQKMETVGQLAGGVAHDFNNMLAVIILRTETSLHLAAADSKLSQNLNSILVAARRSAELVRQLLGFARKQVIAPRMLNLNDAVALQVSMLRRLIGEEIELVWQPAPELWPLWMDPVQVDQILMNLCINARDAISGVGVIQVATGMAHVDAAQAATLTVAGARPATAGDYVTLTVRDNGSGMDAVTLAHIFEPFFTTKEVGKGSGLGLATVYGIVQQNQGYIRVESSPGVGSTFFVYLPRYHAPHEMTVSAAGTPAPAEAQSKTILLVEDETPVLVLAREALEMLGYQVLATASPTEAMRLVEQNDGAIDLLMTDIVMPEMNGHELAKRMTAQYPALRVLYTSGYPRGEVAERGVLAHGVHFLQKPYGVSQLAVKVLEALEGTP